MPTYETTRRVQFTPKQMYDLVADVERYPEFLPMCESLVVTSREDGAEQSVLVATMGVGYGSIRQQFTTRVVLTPAEPLIVVTYLNGPFRRLENRWNFRSAPGGGSDVGFWIDYEFRSPILASLMGAVFDKAFRKFTDAFEARAGVVYGAALPADPAA